MKLKTILFTLLAIILFSSCGAFIQNSGLKNHKVKADWQKDKSLNDFQYDFLYLTQLLEDGFPNLDLHFPKNERALLEKSILDHLKQNPSKSNFLIQGTKYLARLHNQHTTINLKLDNLDRYPFWIHIYQDKWYLLNVDKSVDSTFLGQEILSINDRPVQQIEKELRGLSFSENKIGQQYNIRAAQLFNLAIFLKEIDLIQNVKEALTIKLANEKQFSIKAALDISKNIYTLQLVKRPITAYQKKTYFYKLYPKQDFTYLQFNSCHDSIDIMDGIRDYVKPWLNPLARGFVKGQMKKMRKGKKGNPQISHYYNPDYPVFYKMIWEMIEVSNEKNIENLVIDLRFNPGGNTILGKQLLYFLTEDENLKDYTEYVYTSALSKIFFKKKDKAFRKAYFEKYQQAPKENYLYKWSELSKEKSFFEDIKNPNAIYHVPSNRPRFKGKVYILANYGSGSAAALITTMFQDNNQATVIGTSVGNNPTGATTWTPMKLPKTKASVSIATQYQERPDPKKGTIQMPDHWIEFSVNDVLEGRDPYLQKAFELMKK